MDYKKYSLEQLSNWIHDAMSCGEATPQEIYDVIIEVVKDNYYTYKHQASKAYELLTLLNSNPLGEEVKELGKLWDKEDVEAILKEREYYEPSMPPWGHSDLEYLACSKDDPSPECKGAWNDFWEKSTQYSEEELNAMCDKAASDQEKEKCREYNLREAEYYNKRAEIDAENKKVEKNGGYDYTPLPSKDKVVKWQLPVQVDGLTGDCFVEFPDDLLEVAGLKEGDVVEWVDRGDGSFEMRKVNGSK